MKQTIDHKGFSLKDHYSFFSGEGIEYDLTKVIATIIGGVIGGFCFALLMKYKANRLYKKTIIEITNGEKLIKEGGANHFKGREAVGGKLVLTDRRLIFKSHRLNIQNHQLHFPINKIVQVQTNKILNIFNTGLLLQMENNEIHKFVVDEPSAWVTSITEQRNLATQQA